MSARPYLKDQNAHVVADVEDAVLKGEGVGPARYISPRYRRAF